MGPDSEHLDKSLDAIKSGSGFHGTFDILSSHNAGGDTSAKESAWAELVTHAGSRPAWSSENPACFTIDSCTKYSNMNAVLNSRISGLTSWNTLNDDVTLPGGQITAKGSDIASHVKG